MFQKKQRYKPFYKQFLQLKQNVQNRKKIFKFKKQKWKKFQLYAKKQLKFYKKFKLQDPFGIKINKFTSKGNSFQKKYKNLLIERKIFNLFYGGLKKKYYKKNIDNINKLKKYKTSKFLNFKHHLLKLYESRLDVVLYTTKFSISVKKGKR